MQHLRPTAPLVLSLVRFLLPTLGLAASPVSGQATQAPAPVSLPTLEVVYVHPDYALPTAATAAPRPVSVLGAEDALVTCFANDRNPTTLGLLLPSPAPGFEVLDWGVKSCGTSGWIGALGLGYLTLQTDPSQGGPGAKFGLRFYQGTTGGAGGKGVLIADLVATGFPGTTQGGFLAVTGVAGLGQPFRLPDGPIGWSYYDAGDYLSTTPLGVQTDGGPCALPADPLTGTLDCLDVYDASDTFLFSFASSSGTSSSYLELHEESAVVSASTNSFNAGTNPASYTATTAVLGELWQASVAVGSTGHTTGLVFGFDSAGVVPLGGGQTLLAVDGGSGELLGLAPAPGPLATFQLQVAPFLPAIGVRIHTQAIHFGGTVPFLLSNRLSLVIGTQ